ncbi:hypothetical protein SETIT_7G100200v2 [Setaria italica]|uniref:DUF4378 domain-containing protein n=1 Tax=Setaria italica TaxID=4555 RepID=A0A368RVT2_SETIT|nr:hypothetical protein SETIT_7G100200v2 [Setaria italica]
MTRLISTVLVLLHMILWTFKRRSLTIDAEKYAIKSKLRYTHLLLYDIRAAWELTSSEFLDLLHEEAINIVTHHPWMQGIDLAIITECYLYELFLLYSFHRATGFDWVAHAPSYWTCDRIIKEDGIRKISDTLHQEICWVHDASELGMLFEELMEDDVEAPCFGSQRQYFLL